MGDCVIWQGYTMPDGYGRQRVADRMELVHRIAYAEVHGPIPDGLTVDHICFTKACINVAHLRLLSRLDNQRNQRSAQKTQCVNGHEYTPENTYIRTDGRQRDCRSCIRDRVARYKSRRRAA